MTVCERIDAILEERGISRRKLAEMSGISPSSLQSAMTRNTGLSLDMLFPISEILGLSIEYLKGTEKPQDSILIEKIRCLCRESGITVTELERIMGFSQSTIGKWKSAVPSVDKLSKVAKYFNISMDWLCGLSNAKTKDCEISAICDYIGLDEDTVSLFRNLKQTLHWNEVVSHILRIAEIMNKEELS